MLLVDVVSWSEEIPEEVADANTILSTANFRRWVIVKPAHFLVLYLEDHEKMI